MLGRIEQIPKTIKYAILMIGINDLKNKNIHIESLNSNYIKIIQSLLKMNIIPIINYVLYISSQWEKDEQELNNINTHINIFNSLLKDYCNKHNLIFIELNEKLSLNNRLNQLYSHDGLHINGEGYKTYATIIKNQLKLITNLSNKET